MAWLMAAVAAGVAFLIGFIWLPSLEEGGQGGLWGAICRAVGIYRPVQAAAATQGSVQIPTDVAWSAAALKVARSGDAKRGSALAAACAGCHGEKGVSPSDAFPNLAGMPADVTYKQLGDFRSGKRQNPIMQGIAASLNDEAIVDLAAHFAELPAGRRDAYVGAPELVTHGSPMRSIAPCAACHGPLGHKLGAPPLSGQKRAYLRTQLEAFATGTRHNDINQQMREVARTLSATERDVIADWYDEKRHP
jgi:cytochrome c553